MCAKYSNGIFIRIAFRVEGFREEGGFARFLSRGKFVSPSRVVLVARFKKKIFLPIETRLSLLTVLGALVTFKINNDNNIGRGRRTPVKGGSISQLR